MLDGKNHGTYLKPEEREAFEAYKAKHGNPATAKLVKQAILKFIGYKPKKK
jgi:hypothetical protein